MGRGFFRLYTSRMRHFSARETEWLLELDGIELAGFRRRSLAFIIDWAIVSLVLTLAFLAGAALFFGIRALLGHPLPDLRAVFQSDHYNIASSEPEYVKYFDSEPIHIITDTVIPVLYFGILLWRGKGRTPGKRIMKIRVVSLMHRHLSFWHCVERALGYAAAALELGFGFMQYFIHPYRRCAQDRLAETIVVTERGYQAMQKKASHPLIPDRPSHAAQ
jgi:uncharacterized RDD family membrane protein YckC